MLLRIIPRKKNNLTYKNEKSILLNTLRENAFDLSRTVRLRDMQHTNRVRLDYFENVVLGR